MRLVDSHCHLQAQAFELDVGDVLASARAAGLERLLVPGWDVPSSRAALDLVARHPWLDAAVGIHPHDAAAADGTAWASLVESATDHRVVAIGETGLDFDRVFSPIEAQLPNLRRHLDLALALAKPVILHCRSRPGGRDAQDTLLIELRSAGFGQPDAVQRFDGRPCGVLHSFSGPVDYALEALSLGFAVSFSGLAFRRGEEPTAEVARLVPADRLLVETDSPYLSPPGAPRRRNAPEWVAVTALWVATERGAEPDSIGAGLVATYDLVFGRRPA